ncbi:MAG: hypothetical protein KF751_10655 [Nitrospira sp.]|nr:hypothetical protein [Nitrospira sp.]
MKIYPNLSDGTVHIILTAREAVRLAEKLFRTAMQSGGAVEAGERQESTEEDVEAQEQ